MKNATRIGLVFGFTLAICVTNFDFQISRTAAQETSSRRDVDDDLRSELGVRQRLVERKMVELENKFTATAERLKEKEPERAKLLVAAYQQAKETLITRKMNEASQLLDQGRLREADATLDEVVQRLDDLVRLLLDDQSNKMTKQQEIDQMQQWKKTIQNLRREQTKQTRETKKVANKENTLAKLDAQIQRLSKLIDQQQQVIEATEKNEGAGIRALDKVADQQFEVRKDTENLAKEIAEDGSGPKDSKPTDSDAKTSDPRQGDPQQGDPQQGDPQQGDPQQGDPQQGDPQQGDPQQGDPQQGDPQQGDPQQGDPQQGDPQQGDPQQGDPQQGDPQQQNQPPQPGQQPLQKATDHQRKAEEKLGSGKSKDAKREEQKAADELAKARDELKKERRRLASLPPEAFEQMAREQRRTRDKALDLIEKMAKAPKQKKDGDNNPTASDGQKQQPGQQPVADASESMNKAADDLNNEDPKQAERQQREAEKKLETALKEIEDRLKQLREETREEKLKRLEARFSEMLDRQRVASVMTTEVNDKKTNLGDLRRRDQLVVLRLATEELEISELGQQAYDLLLEDGTSDVIPEIVQDLRADLNRASQLLQDERTDQLTQLLQRDILSTLTDLLEALQESKQENKQNSGGGGGGGGGDQPLLKLSAELKMLRAAQHRLNRRTMQLDRMNENGEDIQLMEVVKQELGKLSKMQTKLLEMAEKIMEKSQQ